MPPASIPAVADPTPPHPPNPPPPLQHPAAAAHLYATASSHLSPEDHWLVERVTAEYAAAHAAALDALGYSPQTFHAQWLQL